MVDVVKSIIMINGKCMISDLQDELRLTRDQVLTKIKHNKLLYRRYRMKDPELRDQVLIHNDYSQDKEKLNIDDYVRVRYRECENNIQFLVTHWDRTGEIPSYKEYLELYLTYKLSFNPIKTSNAYSYTKRKVREIIGLVKK